jgi:hypothetical protein
MNTYEITFTRENGSTGKDRITAANEKQARKDFREIYRHSSATITDVIVAAENVPASKQQERDALDQIRAIVDTLGPDSYLATAFAGCFEDAEENIKNDFACSMKQRLESAEAKRIEAELGYNRLVDKLAASEKALEAARADIEKKDEEIAALNVRISAIQRPTEPAEISDELLADLATFSSVYIERIQKAIIENAGQIAKNATLVRPACYLDSDLLISIEDDEATDDVTPEHAGEIIAALAEQYGGTFATEDQLTTALSFMLGTLRATREKEARHE